MTFWKVFTCGVALILMGILVYKISTEEYAMEYLLLSAISIALGLALICVSIGIHMGGAL